MNATQLPLPDAPRFAGSDYLPFRDDERLTDQMRRVWKVMADRGWHTLSAIHERTGDGEASISAQLRHFRKPRFGAHTVDKRYLGDGLFEYRITPNPDAERVIASAAKRPSRKKANQ